MEHCFISRIFTTAEEAFEAINHSLESGNIQETLQALQSEFAGMVGIIREDCAEEYFAALKRAHEEKGEVRRSITVADAYTMFY